jgi:tetratricopeptide (TPR) repeat protein
MKVAELLQKADEMFKGRQYEDARLVYEEASQTAREYKLNSDLTESLAMVARCHLIQGDKETGRPIIMEAEKVAQPKEPLGWSRYLGVRGRFEWQDGEMTKAKATFVDMYNYCSGEKLYDRAIDAAHMVAIVGTPEEQVEWGKKGIQEAEAGNVTGWLGPLWNNLGATYEDQKLYPKAVEAYLKAREYHHKYSDELAGVIADWAVAHAYRLNENYDEAEKWLDGILEKFEKLEANEFIGWTHKELGEIELHKGNKGEALTHLIEAEKRLKAEKMDEWDSDGYKKLLEQIEALKD